MSEDPSAKAASLHGAALNARPDRFGVLLVVAATHELLDEVRSHIDRNYGRCDVFHGTFSPERFAAGLAAPGTARFPEAEHGGVAPPVTDPAAADVRLSERQFAVLQHLAAGLMNKQIADRLCVCEATIKAHLSQIYRALKVSNRTQALAAARSRGWLR